VSLIFCLAFLFIHTPSFAAQAAPQAPEVSSWTPAIIAAAKCNGHNYAYGSCSRADVEAQLVPLNGTTCMEEKDLFAVAQKLQRDKGDLTSREYQFAWCLLARQWCHRKNLFYKAASLAFPWPSLEVNARHKDNKFEPLVPPECKREVGRFLKSVDTSTDALMNRFSGYELGQKTYKDSLEAVTKDPDVLLAVDGIAPLAGLIAQYAVGFGVSLQQVYAAVPQSERWKAGFSHIVSLAYHSLGLRDLEGVVPVVLFALRCNPPNLDRSDEGVSFNFAWNMLSDDSFDVCAEQFIPEECKGRDFRLDFRHNDIVTLSDRMFLPKLWQGQVSSLDLGYNSIRNWVSTPFVDSLTVLNLADNQLTAIGVLPSCLYHLDLQGNELQVISAEFLNALSRCKNLSVLNVSRNRLSDSEIRKLQEFWREYRREHTPSGGYEGELTVDNQRIDTATVTVVDTKDEKS
jgi:hypothetical protein